MSEVVEHIPELKGVDFDIFIERLNQDITAEEANEVRKWALCTTYQFID
jgi:hypothetical protein